MTGADRGYVRLEMGFQVPHGRNLKVLNLYDYPRFVNAIAYDEMKEAQEQEHLGKWVVIADSELLGAYKSFDEAQQAAIDAGFDYLNCCIRPFGVEPMPIILLGD